MPLSFMRDPLGYYEQAKRRYGGVVRIPFQLMTFYLVTEPELVEHVLVTDSKSYVKDFFIRLLGREVTGRGIFTSDGEPWRQHRRMIQPAFHREKLAAHAETMIACARDYADSLAAGETRELEADMMALTLRVILRTMVSVDDAAMRAELSEVLREISDRFATDWTSPLPFLRRLPLPANIRFERTRRRLDEVVARLVSERRSGKTRGDDLLSMLLEARYDDGGRLSDEQVRDELVTMLVAGQDTTAVALTYAFWLMSQHPEVERALHAELDSVVGDRQVEASDLPALKYAEAIVLETLRLYPSAWSYLREAVRDTQIGGYAVPKGTVVAVCPWVMHRDESLFAQPLAFRPERWLDGLRKKLPRAAYVPFSVGPRQCIGNVFAVNEATLVLATVASRVRLRVPEGPSGFVLTFSLRPRGGLSARVEAR